VVAAVNEVSFVLRKGETLGVVGESGSGKSSLGRLLIKLLDNDGGRILFEGRDIAEALRRGVPAAAAADPDDLPGPLRLAQPALDDRPHPDRGPDRARGALCEGARGARALARACRLDAGAFGRYPHEFSGGQRQRIGIARALMFKPKLLIADEAVSALDVSIQAQILQLLDQVQRETGVSMIFITHDLRVASQICDEIAVMQKGRIVESGPPSQIFLDPQSAYTRELVAAIPGEQPGSSARSRHMVSKTDGGCRQQGERDMTKQSGTNRLFAARGAAHDGDDGGRRPRRAEPAGQARLRPDALPTAPLAASSSA
jgi:peptide/nickel transport system ATP-binding protein